IAGYERHVTGDERQDFDDAVFHILRRVILAQVAVDAERDSQVLRIGHLVGRYDGWPEGRERIKRFPHPARPHPADTATGHVDPARISSQDVKCPLVGWEILGRSSNHKPQLSLM